jgi:hypothetical protein
MRREYKEERALNIKIRRFILAIINTIPIMWIGYKERSRVKNLMVFK